MIDVALDELKSALPDYAKDLKLNLGSVIGNSELPQQLLWGTVFACAIASRSPIVLREIEPEAKTNLSPEAYTAAKAAMHGMSRSLARDWGQHGIRVNTLVPGWIMTEKQLTTIVGPAENAMIDAGQALKGRVYPVDIARMALFLAADDSKMISAQDFIVDGGWAH